MNDVESLLLLAVPFAKFCRRSVLFFLKKEFIMRKLKAVDNSDLNIANKEFFLNMLENSRNVLFSKKLKKEWRREFKAILSDVCEEMDSPRCA